jgi:hypothetical protein
MPWTQSRVLHYPHRESRTTLRTFRNDPNWCHSRPAFPQFRNPPDASYVDTRNSVARAREAVFPTPNRRYACRLLRTGRLMLVAE